MNLVSVIIPNYNHAAFLQQRIDSVLNQSYDNFEVVILDDCSTDNSVEVINDYQNNPKVSHVLLNEQNSGSTFIQWKKGLELAKGNWIWIAESDDAADPEFLKKLTSKIDDNIGVIYCRSNLVNEKAEKIKLYNFSTMPDPDVYPQFNKDFTMDGKEFVKRFMLNMNSVPNASAAIFKKDLIDIDIFQEASQTKLVGDWLFWLHLFNKADVVYIHETLNNFRFHQKTVRNETLFTATRLIEYIRLVKFLEREFSCGKEALDCLLYHYLSGEIPRSNIKFKEHLKINTFVLSRNPSLLIKSYFRKLT